MGNRETLRVVFNNEYSCEKCGAFIGHIDKAYYDNDKDLILCNNCAPNIPSNRDKLVDKFITMREKYLEISEALYEVRKLLEKGLSSLMIIEKELKNGWGY